MIKLLRVHRIGCVNSDCFFLAVFEGDPSTGPDLEDLTYAQEIAGYAPAGYGMPLEVSREFVQESGVWKIEFRCSSDCE